MNLLLDFKIVAPMLSLGKFEDGIVTSYSTPPDVHFQLQFINNGHLPDVSHAVNNATRRGPGILSQKGRPNIGSQSGAPHFVTSRLGLEIRCGNSVCCDTLVVRIS